MRIYLFKLMHTKIILYLYFQLFAKAIIFSKELKFNVSIIKTTFTFDIKG